EQAARQIDQREQQQRQQPAVEAAFLRFQRFQRLVVRFAVQGWIDIGTAADDQPVEAAEVARPLWGNAYRTAAGTPDRQPGEPPGRQSPLVGSRHADAWFWSLSHSCATRAAHCSS